MKKRNGYTNFLIDELKHFARNKKIMYKTFSLYNKIHQESITEGTREAFWEKEANELIWFKKWDKVLNSDNKPFYKWFDGGKINMGYNCIDRHVQEGYGKNLALIWESAYLNKSVSLSYDDILVEVTKLSKILKEKFDINKGDRVIIYMPNIPEAIIAILTCARLGAIHSVVFGGFAAEELSDRIKNSHAKLIISTSVGIEPKKKIPYYPIVKEALQLINQLGSIPILLHQREDCYVEKDILKQDKTYIYQEEMSKCNKTGYDIKAEETDSTNPLYILYTSGTTGTPKGIVRDIGGTCVALNFSTKNVMDIDRGDRYLAASDIGWVVGHSYIVYGPLIRGGTSILYEGKPVGTPHCGKLWELVTKYKIKSMFTSPTALRAIKKEDKNCNIMKTYDLSYLKVLHIAGEMLDTDTVRWINEGLNGKTLINDNWWQTETGWQISSNNVRLETFPLKPGAAGKPMIGYDIKVVNENVEEDSEIIHPDNVEILPNNKLGSFYVKLPMPPSFMSTLWCNDQGFIEKYFTKDGKYYITGDAGIIDENGYLFIKSRTDDIINVAAHRLSCGHIEEVIMKNVKSVVEAAVTGLKDEIKGEVPIAFIVCDSHINYDSAEQVENVLKEVKEQVVHHIGAISRLHSVILVHRLPKTKTGKILRGLLGKICNKVTYKINPTIEDPHVVDEIILKLKESKLI